MSAPANIGGTLRRRGLRLSASSRLTIIGAAMLAVLLVLAFAAPLVAPHDPDAMEVQRVLGGVTLKHPFGSDVLGRDVLSRTIYGLQVSLLLSLSAVAVALVLAVPLGVIAGYCGLWVDSAISRTLDMILVLPPMLLAVSFIAILGPGSAVAALAIAVIYLPILARVTRASTLVVARTEYVAGARARGASHLRVIVFHVLPNALGPVVVQASILSAFAIQLEAGLSFLGLGVQPPTPSLGSMLANGRDVLNQAPWVEFFPGIVIALAVLSFTFLGEGLRRAFDPQGVSE